MPAQYTYPNSATLVKIGQSLLASYSLDDPVFKYIFPIVKRNSARLRWEIRDNWFGLMKARGLGGEPTRVNEVGVSYFETTPGVFGEFMSVDETFMTEAGILIPGNIVIPVATDDKIFDHQAQLMARYYNRMKQMAWTMATTGAVSVSLPQGGVAFAGSFTPQTSAPNPLWSSTTTAHPLKDLRGLQVTYGRGTSNNFGSGAIAMANSFTWNNYLFANTNANDWGGYRQSGGGTFKTKADYDSIRLGEGLPEILVVDDGYLDDSNAWAMGIPDGVILVVGTRPDGELPGEFQLTRHSVNGGGVGLYSFVDDKSKGPAISIPPRIDTHCGFNGGNVMYRASQLLIYTVI